MRPFKIRAHGRVYVDRATVVAQLDEALLNHGDFARGIGREVSDLTTLLDSENPEHFEETS